MGFIAKQIKDFDKYRFGWMSLMIMIQATYASVGAYMSILNDLWSLTTIEVFASMGANAMFIAQANARTCLIGFWLSIAITTVVVIINTIVFVM